MSGFLLDTNILSELVKPRPEPKVTTWLGSVDENLFFISVLTLGEIRRGVALLSNSARRTQIEAWLEADLRRRFSERILPITEDIADRWGNLSGQARAKNIFIPVIDGLLAATALHHNLTLVTRNIKDVSATNANLFNPWDS